MKIDLSRLSPGIRDHLCGVMLAALNDKWSDLNQDIANMEDASVDRNSKAYSEMREWRNACRDLHFEITLVKKS